MQVSRKDENEFLMQSSVQQKMGGSTPHFLDRQFGLCADWSQGLGILFTGTNAHYLF
jgi:hypothetical protein